MNGFFLESRIFLEHQYRLAARVSLGLQAGARSPRTDLPTDRWLAD